MRRLRNDFECEDLKIAVQTETVRTLRVPADVLVCGDHFEFVALQ